MEQDLGTLSLAETNRKMREEKRKGTEEEREGGIMADPRNRLPSWGRAALEYHADNRGHPWHLPEPSLLSRVEVTNTTMVFLHPSQGGDLSFILEHSVTSPVGIAVTPDWPHG